MNELRLPDQVSGAAASVRTGAASQGAIRIEDAVKVYGPRDTGVLAVDHCSLDIPAGRITMVVGPSGCGKTTLLNAIAGFHSLTSGAIYLDGTMLCGPGRLKAEPGPDRIVVFQNGALFPWRTVLDNVIFGPVMQGSLRKKEAIEKGHAMLADAGLETAWASYPGEISSGMRRRVEIVRALMNDPKVLLLDEPYRALDSLTKSVMHEALLETFYRSNVTIFFITHDLEEAVFLGDQVAVMTSRPCRMKKLLEVDLPHPRTYSVVTSSRYRAIMDETIGAVHEEAAKAFAAGEREG